MKNCPISLSQQQQHQPLTHKDHGVFPHPPTHTHRSETGPLTSGIPLSSLLMSNHVSPPFLSLLSSSWGQEKPPCRAHFFNVGTVNWRDSWGDEAVTGRLCEKASGPSLVGSEWSWSRLCRTLQAQPSCRFSFFLFFLYCFLFCFSSFFFFFYSSPQSRLSLRRRCTAHLPTPLLSVGLLKWRNSAPTSHFRLKALYCHCVVVTRFVSGHVCECVSMSTHTHTQTPPFHLWSVKASVCGFIQEDLFSGRWAV